MNSCIAVRDGQKFIFTRIGDEKQKVKKQDQLKEILTDSEFTMKGSCAISLLLTKLDIVNTILMIESGRSVIQQKTGTSEKLRQRVQKAGKKGT